MRFKVVKRAAYYRTYLIEADSEETAIAEIGNIVEDDDGLACCCDELVAVEEVDEDFELMSTDAPHPPRDSSPVERLVGELSSKLAEFGWLQSGQRPPGMLELLDRAATFVDHAPALADAARLGREYCRIYYETPGNCSTIRALERMEHDQAAMDDALAAYDADNAATKRGAK